jgi:L,D-transpeptidase YcbB
MRRLSHLAAVSCVAAILSTTAVFAESATGWPDVTPKWWTPPAGSAEATTKPDAATPTAGSTTPAPGGTRTEASAPTSPQVISAAELKLADKGLTAKFNKADVDALAAHYRSGSATPLWSTPDGYNDKAKSVLSEVSKAADWGLDPTAFDMPALPAGSLTTDQQADGEARLTLTAMKYARFARGGRLNPSSLSRILDMVPPVKDAKDVIAGLASASEPSTYLVDQHPKHEQFQRLHQALLKVRGPAVADDEPVDEALKIKLPDSKATLKTGAESDDIALLRKRLKVPAEPGAKDTLFDAKLSEAVTAFQVEKDLKPTGQLNAQTRKALNSVGEPKKSSPAQTEQRLIVNMEKWRWMPENLGSPYIMNNVPEFHTRMVKDGKEIFKERIIAGQPEWATPMFSSKMEFVIFNPSWGVPDGIKVRELMPRIKKATGGDSFFDLFSGGGGGGARVLKAYGLVAYKNGKQVDPNSINWNSTDIRSFSFTQPPGGQNPLGFVKFRFPNKHDVYMHDTTQRSLFSQSYRALSHGCMRVQNPGKLAELILAEDRGWSPERVKQAQSSSADVTLDKPLVVHVTYFTAMVDEAGKVSTYGDIYGHDGRISAALGRSMSFDGGNAVEARSTFVADSGNDVIVADDGSVSTGKKSKKGKEAKTAAKKVFAPENMSDAVSGLLTN